ncbi:uncharacterized protein LOC118184212 [Stegodyphus dumicola]|uniref:uncharacterized protein LOC118184212 n=1 Tax=Stegodyphus dumicola TaxID=202533 RepID=UPI0015B032A9|nr:uncharacterized protein LOC118184212 [Stegodyphus dumicola]
MNLSAETCTEGTSEERQAKRKRSDSGSSSQTEVTGENTVTDQSIPSREVKTPWIYAFAPNIKEMEIDSTKVGKWLLFYNNQKKCETTSLTDHDLAWQNIESLVLNNYQNAGIIEAKASTAQAATKFSSGSSSRVICCYVADYTNKYEVKRAADAIRRVISLSFPIYFKTDEATYARQYSHLGKKNVSMYMHTLNNDLFERDEFGKWRKLDL